MFQYKRVSSGQRIFCSFMMNFDREIPVRGLYSNRSQQRVPDLKGVEEPFTRSIDVVLNGHRTKLRQCVEIELKAMETAGKTITCRLEIGLFRDPGPEKYVLLPHGWNTRQLGGLALGEGAVQHVVEMRL